MTVFRKISNPFKSKRSKDSAVDESPGRKHAPRPTRGEVRAPLDKLMMAESPFEESAVEAKHTIFGIAKQYGPYLTASEIHDYVTTRRAVTENGVELNRGRGHELAGHLYYRSLLREIVLISEEGKRLGPSVFEEYCIELLECFISGENVRHGVGLPIQLTEMLVERAAASQKTGDLYISLAERALNALVGFAERKSETDLQDRQRALRMHRKGDTPPPRKFNPNSMIDKDLVSHLTAIRDQFAEIKTGFEQVTEQLRSASATEGRPKDDAEYLYALVKVTSKVRNFGVAGVLKERLARLLSTRDRARAANFAKAAAVDFMTQGDADFSFSLDTLGLRRYSRAHMLFKWIGDSQTASEIQSKIDELKKLHDPSAAAMGQT